MAELTRFDPHHPSMLGDPHAMYRDYRRRDPVHWGEPLAPGADGCWYLFRHEHVAAVLKDRRFRRRWSARRTAERISSAPPEHRPFLEVLDRLLLSTDPPEHRRLRTLVATAFARRAVESYRPLVRDLAGELVDALPEAAEFDVIERLAVPLSYRVICAVLGAPTDAADDLRAWVTRFGNGLDLRKRPSTMSAAGAATTELLGYFGGLVAQRRRRPRADLVSALIGARDRDDRLTEDELLAMIIQLVFAGHETTVGQIGATVLALLDNPDQLTIVRRDPGLVPNAVNEGLRHSGSVHTAAARKPTRDVRVGDKLVKAGEPVIAFIAAANRDPEVFADPDRFDLGRDTSEAIPFGAGVHYCLGAPLARLQVEVAVDTLLRRFPDLRAVPGRHPEYRANIVLPGLARLAVRGSITGLGRSPVQHDARPDAVHRGAR